MDNRCDRVRNDGCRDVVIQLAVLHLRAMRGQKRNGSRLAENVYIGPARYQCRPTLALINEYKPH